ncbi:Protein of unknown function, partial [Gryllus bimaculatus]
GGSNHSLTILHRIHGQALASRFARAVCVELPGRQMVRALVRGAVDVCSELIWLTREVDTPHTYPHQRDDLCVVVRRQQRVPQTILRSFSADTDAVLGALDAFVNGGFAERAGDGRANALLLLLSAAGLVLVNAFTGRFMSFLTVLGDPPQLDTLRDVAAHVDRVYGDATLRRQLHSAHPDDVIWKLLDMLAEAPQDGNPLDVARREFAEEERGPAYIMSLEQARLLVEGRNMTDAATGAPLAHLVAERALSLAYVAFMTRPRWPQRARFDRLLQFAFEAGLPLKFDSDYRRELRALGILHRGPALAGAAGAEAEEPRALRLQALMEPAAYLGAGLLAAAAAFAAEVAQGALACRRRRRRRRLRRRAQRIAFAL